MPKSNTVSALYNWLWFDLDLLTLAQDLRIYIGTGKVMVEIYIEQLVGGELLLTLRRSRPWIWLSRRDGLRGVRDHACPRVVVAVVRVLCHFAMDPGGQYKGVYFETKFKRSESKGKDCSISHWPRDINCSSSSIDAISWSCFEKKAVWISSHIVR